MSPAINPVLCLLCIMLMPLAAAGLALIHQGLGRSRSAAHAMLATLCAFGVSAIIYILSGLPSAGLAGNPVHSFMAAGFHWDWLGGTPFFATGGSAADSGNFTRALTLCLQLFAVGMAAIVPLSAGTDRWRLGSICFASALLAGIFYPLFSHWVWGGGWLAQLGANFGIPNFVDLGGAGVIQVVGGLMALSVAWITGPRRGKFAGRWDGDGDPGAQHRACALRLHAGAGWMDRPRLGGVDAVLGAGIGADCRGHRSTRCCPLRQGASRRWW